jgi:hypothetical protein
MREEKCDFIALKYPKVTVAGGQKPLDINQPASTEIILASKIVTV